nr:hypothetical protein [Tanacetum cinerariifolium]
MSLEESDDLNILDAALVDPALEACSLPKFDMHLTFIRGLLWRNKTEKNCKPCLKDAPTSLEKWKDKVFLVDQRAAPIAMAWRHHDSSVADPFPRPSEYNASEVAKLRDVIISLRKPPLSVLYVSVITVAEFLRLPNFEGCKVSADALLPPSAARVSHLASSAERLDDIPPKTGNMMTVEIPCRKVATKKGAGREGGCKNRKVRVGDPVNQDSEHVSSPTSLNHALTLETLANTEQVSPNVSAGRMSVLRNQTDEHVPPPPLVNAGVFVTGGDGIQENVVAFVNEGHGDNEGGVSGLQTQPSPPRPADLLETLEKSARDKAMPEVEASYSCRDMMSNLFTPADIEFFNEGVCNEFAVKRSWKLLCQSAQQQANILLRFEALTEEHADLFYAHDSCKDVKARFKECKKELATSAQQQSNVLLRFEAFTEEHADLLYAHDSCKDVKVRFKECKKELAIVRSAYDEKTSAYDQLSKNYDGALTREKSLQDRVKELEKEK